MTTTMSQLPSHSFRLEHAELEQRLAQLESMVGSLPGAMCDEQAKLMTAVVSFLKGNVRSHAQWEERVLYPVVDHQAGSGREPFRASRRYERRIIVRWVDELLQEASRPSPTTAPSRGVRTTCSAS